MFCARTRALLLRALDERLDRLEAALPLTGPLGLPSGRDHGPRVDFWHVRCTSRVAEPGRCPRMCQWVPVS